MADRGIASRAVSTHNIKHRCALTNTNPGWQILADSGWSDLGWLFDGEEIHRSCRMQRTNWDCRLHLYPKLTAVENANRQIAFGIVEINSDYLIAVLWHNGASRKPTPWPNDRRA